MTLKQDLDKLMPLPDRIEFIDIETYFDKNNINLKKMPMARYAKETQMTSVVGFGYRKDYNGKWSKDKDPYTWNRLDDGHERMAFENLNINQVTWVVAHNAAFDLHTLNTQWHMFGDSPPENVYYVDTLMLAQYLFHSSQIVGPRASLGLDNLGEKLLDTGKLDGFELLPGMGKEELSTEGGRIYMEQLMKYNIRDVEVLVKLFFYLIKKVPRVHLYTCHWALCKFVHPKLNLHRETIIRHLEEQLEHRNELIANVGGDLSTLRSRPKCADFIESRGYKVPMKTTATGNKAPQLAQGDPFIVENKNAQTELGDLIRARLAASSNIEITRAESFLGVGTDKYHYHVMPSGTFTHRLAGRNGGGGNPLNLSRDSKLRRAIVAPDGCKVIVFDYSKLELMIARFCANDLPAMASLSMGADLYSEFIAGVLRKHLEEVTSGERFVGKQSELSLQYGVGDKTFCKAVNASGKYTMTMQLAQQIVQAFRVKQHPAVVKAWNQCEHMMHPNFDKRLEAFSNPRMWGLKFPGRPVPDGWQWPSGRVIRFPNMGIKRGDHVYYPQHPLESTAYRKIYGAAYFQTLCQSLANEVIDACRRNLALAGLECEFECYDELGIVVTEKIRHEHDGKDDLFNKIQTIASTCHHDWWPDGPNRPDLSVDIGIGDNYYDAKP